MLKPEQFARGAIDFSHRNIAHPLLTRGEASQDREIAHERAIKLMEKAQDAPMGIELLSKLFSYEDPILHTDVAGVTALNPLGIAAGFDKNARVHNLLGNGLGFGSVTVGSITKIKYEGNPRPRIFDLPHSQAVINRMGFPGEGIDSVKKRLEATKDDPRKYLLVVNFAASAPSFSKFAQLEHYADAAQELREYGDFGEVNVSSPNTFGVKGLQEPEMFRDLADAVLPPYHVVDNKLRFKFGPDLDPKVLVKNAETIIDRGGAGITVPNTSTNEEVRASLARTDAHREEAGGISGRPLTERALQVSHDLYTEIGDEIPIHRVGGVSNVRDVWNALTYGGATTVDVYTAFIRRETSTPNFTHNILKDLAAAMRAEGMSSMEDFKELRGKKVPYPLGYK